jgi:hypothetical protein
LPPVTAASAGGPRLRVTSARDEARDARVPKRVK